jgi:hypothetical protein
MPHETNDPGNYLPRKPEETREICQKYKKDISPYPNFPIKSHKRPGLLGRISSSSLFLLPLRPSLSPLMEVSNKVATGGSNKEERNECMKPNTSVVSVERIA